MLEAAIGERAAQPEKVRRRRLVQQREVLLPALPRLEHRPLVQQRNAVVGDAVAAAEGVQVRLAGERTQRAIAGGRPREVHLAERVAAAQVRDPGVRDRRARQVEAFEPRQAPDLDEVGVGDVAHAAEIERGGVAALDGLPKRQRLRLRDRGDVRRAPRQVGDGRAQRLPAVEAALARDERPRVVQRDRDVAVRLARPLAEIELDVAAHAGPGAPVPGVAVVPLHRLGRAGAIGVEQRLRHVVVLGEGGGAAGGVGLEGALQGGPAVEALFAGEGELHVAQRRCVGGVRQDSAQACPGLGLTRGERGQPAPGVLLQRCEGAAGERMRHDTFLHVPDVR